MPPSNLTHYQQHTINKQHTNSVSAMESVSVEFRDPFECSLRGGIVSWLPLYLHIPPQLTEGMARIRYQTILIEEITFLLILSPNSRLSPFYFHLPKPYKQHTPNQNPSKFSLFAL